MTAIAITPVSGKAAPRLAVLTALAIGAGLFSATNQQAMSAEGGTTTQPVGSCSSAPNATKSPKELALADFLKTMKREGQPVLIEFGLVGCELSEKGFDEMIALEKSKAVPGLAFIRVEGSEDAAAVKKYYKDKNPPFPVHQDSKSALAQALRATTIPAFVLTDKFGHIRYTGKYPQETIVPWAKALMAETKDPGSQAPLLGVKTIDPEKLLVRKLPDLTDTSHTLNEYPGTGGLLVLFVDTTCPFSATALKDMPMVSKALAGQKIKAVVVNNDDSRQKVLDYYAKNNPGTPVLYDVGAATREEWNVQSVPIAVYVTSTGKIGYQGQAIWANMGSAMETSLGLAAGTIKFTAAGTGFG